MHKLEVLSRAPSSCTVYRNAGFRLWNKCIGISALLKRTVLTCISRATLSMIMLTVYIEYEVCKRLS